jgi:hypothetical protein
MCTDRTCNLCQVYLRIEHKQAVQLNPRRRVANMPPDPRMRDDGPYGGRDQEPRYPLETDHLLNERVYLLLRIDELAAQEQEYWR